MKKRRLSVWLSLITAFGLFASHAAHAQVKSAKNIPARLQIIHNAADPLADTVDIWVNNDKALPDFAFRNATPFFEIIPGEYQVRIKPKGSTDTTNPLLLRTLNLSIGETAIAVAVGNAGTGFAANPSGVSTALDIITFSGLESNITTPDSTAFRILHGSTDAPAVDIKANRAVTLAAGAPYKAFTDYIKVPSADYRVGVYPAGALSPVAEFTAPLSAFADSALVVLASGYLDPTANNNGSAFGLLAVTATGRAILLPAATPIADAKLQVIHNAADPIADSVDIWVNNQKIASNFGFRTATPFLTLPAETPLQVRIKLPNSTDTTNPVLLRSYNLPAGSATIAVAVGNAGTGFAANPSGVNTALDIITFSGLESNITTPDSTAFRILHGSTDAPAVDIKANRAVTLAAGAPYKAFTDYIKVPSADYRVGVYAAGALSPVAEFTAPLSAFADSALVVLASGYLDPTANNNGPAFGLLAVTATGRAILLPAATPIADAKLQVIHNAADPIADSVDIWVNNQKIASNFGFRTATPFLNLPAETPLQVRIKLPNSTDTTNPVLLRSYNLPAGSAIIAVAVGNAGTGFAANPSGVSTALDIITFSGLESNITTPDSTAFRILHGSTDAPAVDIKANRAVTLAAGAPYKAFTDYIKVPSADYVVGVYPAGASNPIFEYDAPFTAFRDSALVVIASGYLDPTANNNGSAFGLLAVTATGRAILLPAATPIADAKLQLIHNAADPIADSVDIWVNNQKIASNFGFRTATPFLTLPAETPLQVRIKLPNSTDTTNPVLLRSYNLPAGSATIAVAVGNAGTGFAANPSGVSTALDIITFSGLESNITTPDSTAFRILHGSTDAPAVDIKANRAVTLAAGAPYKAFTDYIKVPSADYVVGVYPAGASNPIFEYDAPFTAFRDSALVVLASGYLSSAANNNGPSFGLLAVTATGRAFLLQAAQSITPRIPTVATKVWPNPVRSGNELSIESAAAGMVSIFNSQGKLVLQTEVVEGLNLLSTSGLPSGMYNASFSSSNAAGRFRFVVE